ncbi:MAG: hypothetical protein ACRCWG_15785 [Sarcina sp.]
MGGDVSLIIPISFALWIFKVVAFKVRDIEVKEMSRFINLILLVVSVMLIMEDSFINNITRIMLLILIGINIFNILKLIARNLILLIEKGEKKKWWLVNSIWIVLMILCIILPYIVLPFVVFCTMMFCYPYIIVMLIVNLVQIKKEIF